MTIDLYDFLGLVGVVFTIYNYARLQWQRDYAKKLRYSVGNFLGATLITVSLLDKWNLAAFVVNVIMALISAYGIYRCLKYRSKQKAPVTIQKIILSQEFG
ncbi:MAG: hypothetical protein WC521_05420 [Bdellovibrionales bacterium]|jgi:hypothetical protein